MDLIKFDEAAIAFMGGEGQKSIDAAYGLLTQIETIATHTLRAAEEIRTVICAVEQARKEMKKGYESSRSYLTPEVIQQVREISAFFSASSIFKK